MTAEEEAKQQARQAKQQEKQARSEAYDLSVSLEIGNRSTVWIESPAEYQDRLNYQIRLKLVVNKCAQYAMSMTWPFSPLDERAMTTACIFFWQRIDAQWFCFFTLKCITPDTQCILGCRSIGIDDIKQIFNVVDDIGTDLIAYLDGVRDPYQSDKLYGGSVTSEVSGRHRLVSYARSKLRAMLGLLDPEMADTKHERAGFAIGAVMHTRIVFRLPPAISCQST